MLICPQKYGGYRPVVARTFIMNIITRHFGGQKCKTVCTTHIAEQDEFSMSFNIDSFVIKYATHYDHRQF